MKHILSLVLLMAFSFCQAQITFEKGYFIDNSGKRTECYIKNMDWKNNPTDFMYKLQLEDTEARTETKNNVTEFGIDNISKYKRFNVKIEKSHTNTNKLTKNKAPNFKDEVLFLNVLIEGEANLYQYTDGLLTKFFFDKKDQPITQLVYIRYLTETGEAAENNQFRQQLLNALKGDNISENDLKKIKYEKSALIKLFEKYNSTSNTAVKKFERKSTAKPFAFKVVAGVTSGSFEMEIPHLKYDQQPAGDFNTDSKISYKVGVEVEYTLPFNKNIWRVFVNPMYSKFEADAQFNTYGLFGDPTSNTVSTQFNLIEIPLGVRRYFYINDASKIFVDAAYVVNVYNGTEIIYNKNQNPVTFDKIDAGGSCALGLGYNYKKFALAASFSLPKKFTVEKVYSGSYKTIGLIASYELF
ncbi:hypothetical protein [Flavobacterium sp.]|uniref:hypothetical protein n=1 Tax=Flavobacterium sp. TaxID=239 RepID=UPI0039E4FC0A